MNSSTLADRLSRSRSGRLVLTLARVLFRTYTLALIALILWVTWRAFSYLITALFVPAEAPQRITEIARRIEAEGLRDADRSALPTETVPHPRSPLAHYHRLESWIQVDPHNNCTTSGCHAPLPHARREETRAFLNMHSTVLHCGVCHMTSPRTPLALTWYELSNAEPSQPPSVLQALTALIDIDADKVPTAEDKRRLVDLLHDVAAYSGNNPQLVLMARRFAAARPGSEQWRRLVKTALATLPEHMRSEYGRKLALKDLATARPILAHPNTADAAQRLRLEWNDADDSRRTTLVQDAHPRRRPEPLACTRCHSPQDNWIDFTALGYPPRRIADLTGRAVFNMVENIAAGRPFYLPQMLEQQDEP